MTRAGRDNVAERIDELIAVMADRSPDAVALQYDGASLDYAGLDREVAAVADLYLANGLKRLERVAVYMEKRLETVAALFGASRAGGTFVPVNPLLKAAQVAHILNDCGVAILVTTPERLEVLRPVLGTCRELRAIVVVGVAQAEAEGIPCASWDDRGRVGNLPRHRVIDADMATILYTSGSSGTPKGVVLSHRNLFAGAASVAEYLGNVPEDRILAVLPLSFDYGLSQLTTAFHAGACAVLMNYLLPRDVLRTLERESITGLAAVPSLWTQLAPLDWPAQVAGKLRYITNSGGRMPLPVLSSLREKLPSTSVYLMYGLTEAFRSTYLPPDQVAIRPDSIGKAIPNAEILVVHPDGTPCGPGEEGELVHRGVHVALGYWNAPELTATRFRPVPGRLPGLPLEEWAVWSGDTVKSDEEGYLYFVGRHDEMIKTSGYRVSPTEIEDAAHATGLVSEAVALGAPHPVLGQAIVLVVKLVDGAGEADLLEQCRRQLPGFMVPAHIAVRTVPLPRNPNGKFDRKGLALEFAAVFDVDPR